MSRVFGMIGIVFAQPIADLIAVLIALGMFLYLNKDFKKQEIY